MEKHIISKAEIESIVQKNMYDLGYKKKFSKEYYTDLVDNVFKTLEFNPKSHSGKPYLSALPHDLRTTDLDKLQERIDAIDEEIDEIDELIGTELWIQEDRQKTIDTLTQENKDLTRIQESLVKDNTKIDKDIDKVIGDALDDASNIRDSWDDLKKMNDTNISPSDKLDTLVRTLNDYVENSGLIYSDEVDSIKSLANDVENYFSSTGDEISDWQQEGIDLSDMIRDFADKYDVNKHPMGDSLEDWQVNFNFIMQHAETKGENNKEINRSIEVIEDSKKTLSQHERVKKDYLDERKRTQDTIDKVKQSKRG